MCSLKRFSSKELTLIGVSLYSCEGTRLRRDKRRKNLVYHWVIEFTNSNPRLIQVFVVFLRKVIKIDENRLKGQLFIYDNLVQKQLEKFWSEVAGIPLLNFNKTIILKQKNEKYKPNPNGTFKIRYHSKEAVQRLIDLQKKILGDF